MTASGSSVARAGRWGLLVCVSLLTAGLATSCMSPREKHRVLTFFFDGVPSPDAEESSGQWTEPEPSEGRVAEVRRRPAPIFVRHEPACDDCHAGSEAAFRLSQPKETLCWECHDPDDFRGAVVHGPVAAGQCGACHSPHKSRFEHLLLSEGASICGKCHGPETFAAIEEHRAEEGENCLACHDPHAADRRYMLHEAEEAS